MAHRRQALSRRHFLKGTGASIALPLLGAMTPTLGARAAEAARPVSRFVAICGGLGFHTPFLFPETTGRDYELTQYLGRIAEHREPLHRVFGAVASGAEPGTTGTPRH